MNNPEKLATLSTQDKDNQTQHNTLCVGHHNTQDTRPRPTKQKHNTICVRHHYTQTNIYKVNKTWDLLQTTGGKDESEI